MFNDAPIERFSFNFAVDGDEITSNIAMDDGSMTDDQSSDQLINQSNNQSFIPAQELYISECSLASQPGNRMFSHSNHQSTDHSMDQSMDQPTNQSFNRTINDGECKLTDDTVTFCSGVTFLRPPINQKPERLADCLVDSDLTKHVYEGGLKLWECAIDLVQFLHDQSTKQSIALDYSSVLDLGCGHGFTGLYPLIYNRSSNQTIKQSINVTFQDLNSDVLIESTMNHALINVANAFNLPIDQSIQVINERCRFISGDWSSPTLMNCLLNNQPNDQKYSLILTSDTLYEPSMLDTILQLITQSMSPHGIALFAAKRYYFGIGGGTVGLMQRVQQIGTMVANVERVIEDGKSNIREIVSIRWKNV